MATPFDTFVTSLTQDGLLPKAVDNILDSNVATVRWLSRAKAWVGETLKIPIKYRKSTSGGSYGIGDTFTTSKVNTRQLLSFDPKFFYQNVTLFGPEVDVNAISESQVINMITIEMESAAQDAMDGVGTLFYGIESGNDFQGVQGIIDDGTFSSTYGGQTRSSNTHLNSTVTTVSGPLTLALMASAQSGAKRGSLKPTIVVTTESVWDDLEALIQPTLSANYQVMGPHKVTRDATVAPGQALGPGQVGFDALMHRGTPVVADEKCNSGEMYFVNETFLDWYGLKSVWNNPIKVASSTIQGYYDADVPSENHGFHWTDLKEPTNENARSGQILLQGNLVSGGPRYSSKLESLT